MVDVIRGFQYKTAGRGRGVLGLKDLRPCRRPGEKRAAGGAGRGEKQPQPPAALSADSAKQKQRPPPDLETQKQESGQFFFWQIPLIRCGT